MISKQQVREIKQEVQSIHGVTKTEEAKLNKRILSSMTTQERQEFLKGQKAITRYKLDELLNKGKDFTTSEWFTEYSKSGIKNPKQKKGKRNNENS